MYVLGEITDYFQYKQLEVILNAMIYYLPSIRIKF